MKKWFAIFLSCIFTLCSANGLASASIGEKLPLPFQVQLPEGKRWGYLDPATLTWKILPQYVRADVFISSADPLTWVKDPNGAFSLINPEGKPMTSPMKFDAVGAPSEGLARFKVGSLWGYLDVKDGSFALPPAYLQAREFSEGLAAVEYKPGKWIYISPAGKRMTLREFSFAYSFQNKRAVAMEYGGFYGVIDTKGEWTLPPKFGAIFPPETGEKLFIAGKVDKSRYSFIPYYELVNSEGFSISSFKADESQSFIDFPAPVKKDHLWGYVAQNGKMAVAFQFENVQPFNAHHLSAAKKDGLWGIISLNPQEEAGFQWVISPTWESEPDLSNFEIASTGESSSSFIQADSFFYDSQGKELACYPNFMTRGAQALQENRKADALSWFQKALEKSPNDPAALHGIAQTK